MRLLILFLCFGFSLNAQLEMQNWRIHFSSYEAVDVTELEGVIYMAAENGIVTYDLNGKEINTITVTNGLSDLGISAIKAEEGVVFIGYGNGNLDLIKDNKIINIPWLKRALLSGDKTINNFYFNDGLVYISTGIGVLVYNIKREEIADTYYPYVNSVVLDLTIFNDSLYVGTSEGVYAADIDNGFLNDVDNWVKKTNFPSYINDGIINEIEVFNGDLFVALDISLFQSDTLYKVTPDNTVEKFSGGITVDRLSAQGDFFVISKFANVLVYDKDLNQTKNIFDYEFGPPPKPFGAVLIENELWIADQNNGLVRAIDAFSNNKQIYANSPFLDGCYKIDIQKGKVGVAGGGLTPNFKNLYGRRGVYLFEDEEWTNINSQTNPGELVDSLDWDIIGISIDPKNTNRIAFSSYSKGGLKIIENGTDIVETYTYENSPIELQLGNTSMIVSDLKYDDKGNLWIANAGVTPLKMLSNDGVWYEYNMGSAAKNKYPNRLMIDSKGYKWMAFNNFGVVVYDDNGTYADQSDDRSVSLTTVKGFGSLPSVQVKSFAEDIDGEIWIGTESGIGVVYSTATLFDGGFGDADAAKIVIFDEEKADNVAIFDEVTVTAIAVDGGNRKWIGTSASGVFCMTPNGKEEVYNFNSSNSPLISNSIVDMKIDYDSGEIFFVTEEGLTSYRGDLTSGDNTFSNVNVFPNPVRPEYRGVITIEGLGYESQVRITDISGNLVYQTVSNGGSVLWDGNRITGERVQTGVYLVWSARVEGKGKNVAKILVVN